jgi:hypothetical protein
LPLESLVLPTKDVVVASCAAALKTQDRERLMAVRRR